MDSFACDPDILCSILTAQTQGSSSCVVLDRYVRVLIIPSLHSLACSCTGNLKQWFSREADAFQKHVALDFGPVVKLRGMIGVRTFHSLARGIRE